MASLTAALRIILRMPDADWATLLAAAPIEAARRRQLLAAEEASLDHLAKELNERRGFDDGERGVIP